MLQSVCPSQEGQDQIIWAFEKSGRFSTKSFTLELDKLKPPHHEDAIKGVWRGLVPHRIEVFVWIALMGKINTRSKLAALGIIPEENNICPMCLSSIETSDHLLLHCNVSKQVWNWWLGLWQINWVFPLNLRDAFNQWCWPEKSIFFKKVWTTIFFIILWTIWKERNKRIFTETKSSIKDMKDLILL